MKPVSFAYHAAQDVDEALSLLSRLGDEAYPLAGGQSLVPLMNFRLVRPAALVDLNRVEALRYISHEEGTLRIGAMTRQREIARSEVVASTCPLLSQATGLIGHFQIRNRGTLGGSLAHADPAAEYPAVAVALGAEVVLRGPAGDRRLPAESFFSGPFSTAKQPDELLVEVGFPTGASAISVKELARRHGDFAIALAAVALRGRGGVIEWAGIGMGGVAPVPLQPRTAIEMLVGQPPSRELFEEAARAAAREAQPSSDIHGSADFRRALVETLTSRALSEAAQRMESDS